MAAISAARVVALEQVWDRAGAPVQNGQVVIDIDSARPPVPPNVFRGPRFEDPFVISRNSAEADRLLVAELKKFGRHELLQRALDVGATIAPVLASEEIPARDIVVEQGTSLPITHRPFSGRITV